MRKKTKARSPEHNIPRAALAGFVSGMAAAYAMRQAAHLWSHASQEIKPSERSDNALSGRGQRPFNEGSEEPIDATAKVAKVISIAVARRELKGKNLDRAAMAVHLLTGGLLGAAYAATAEVAPNVTFAQGMPFGAAVWKVGNEWANPALGLSKKASHYPASTRLHALFAHLVFGFTLETNRALLRRAV